MPPGDGARRYMLILLILWAGLLFGGFVFGTSDTAGEQRMPLWTRIGSSLVLVVAGWTWYWLSRSGTVSSFALLIAVGMTLGFIGDLFMARLLPAPEPVLGGIGAFGLGHIAYVVAMLRFANQQGLDAPGPRWSAWGVWLLIGVTGWYYVVFRAQQPTVLHWAALPYALLLASTAGIATGIALQAMAFVPFAIGGALFLLSDLILAARLFNDLHFRLIGDVIWLAYGPGQMLIVYTIGNVLRWRGG